MATGVHGADGPSAVRLVVEALRARVEPAPTRHLRLGGFPVMVMISCYALVTPNLVVSI